MSDLNRLTEGGNLCCSYLFQATRAGKIAVQFLGGEGVYQLKEAKYVENQLQRFLQYFLKIVFPFLQLYDLPLLYLTSF